ncbi:MAG: cytochrome c oxidase assembly protein [Alphaproteobacteria bacterium]|jgi:cytochrome c oxidase assembly protein subunit 11|nr:cytochrome c oxidase assembly protein [Alphaproteobacteria bacterium]MDP6661140.1 cytochrome c oxidase assembly protein [Alphaproteobacteria bacterium]MDP6780453.1 cytochrome c oxidase assembly protein [Alphaproteobacteria bacterium]MDP7044645.1 cytochrome c oxidase assembly protein [Alphaproteobacteria bacterium]HAQ33410.1 cytochrome c oxidase assembly protein [Rhodospirillaceae bacterium]
MTATPARGEELRRRNRKTLSVLAAVVFGMVGLAYASVPLYRIFCQVTGFGGTTQQAAAAPGAVADRMMTVRFDSSVSPTLPWRLAPAQPSVEIKVGESGLAFFTARNLSAAPITGSAVFNVTPLKVGKYFNKIDCFCFTEQVLAPGQQVDMPVSFFVDPAIMDDTNMGEVKTITLSYTFFRAESGEEETTALLGDSHGG